jgi:Domain of unknown function (DUF4419)
MEKLEPLVGKNLSGKVAGVADSSTVFAVSDVSQADKPLPEIPYYEAVQALLEEPTRKIESCSQHHGRLVERVQFHPFVTSIHKAFKDHRPLCLSPDMIWLLIAQGLANHINANAEQLRSQFVEHQGKVNILIIRGEDFRQGSPDNDWSGVFADFSAGIRKHIGSATHDLLVPTFSTTGLVEKAAAEIVLLDAVQSYFTYGLMTTCGIPKIKLEGTIADWQDLLQRTKRLAQFELHWWIDRLIPILEQFVTAAQGNPDRIFWQSMYKWNDAESSGNPYITGWITDFFPYLKDSRTEEFSKQSHFSHEFTTNMFPSGLAKAPFMFNYNGPLYNMEFISGFLGVKQNPDDLFLRPEIGWVIREVTIP